MRLWQLQEASVELEQAAHEHTRECTTQIEQCAVWTGLLHELSNLFVPVAPEVANCLERAQSSLQQLAVGQEHQVAQANQDLARAKRHDQLQQGWNRMFTEHVNDHQTELDKLPKGDRARESFSWFADAVQMRAIALGQPFSDSSASDDDDVCGSATIAPSRRVPQLHRESGPGLYDPTRNSFSALEASEKDSTPRKIGQKKVLDASARPRTAKNRAHRPPELRLAEIKASLKRNKNRPMSAGCWMPSA